MKPFTLFDDVRIAYHDQGEGQSVIPLHAGFVDGLGQFGEFDRIPLLLEKRQAMLRDVFGAVLPLPNPPEGGQGLVGALLAAGQEMTILGLNSRNFRTLNSRRVMCTGWPARRISILLKSRKISPK